MTSTHTHHSLHPRSAKAADVAAQQTLQVALQTGSDISSGVAYAVYTLQTYTSQIATDVTTVAIRNIQRRFRSRMAAMAMMRKPTTRFMSET